MKNRTAVLVVTVAVVGGFAAWWSTLHRAAAPGPVVENQATPLAPPQTEVGETRGYRFKRLIHARLGAKDLVDLRLRGTLWIDQAESSSDSYSALVRIENVEAAGQSRADLPLARVAFTEKGGPPSVVNVQMKSDAESRDASARFAIDLVDQYRFFASTDLQGRYEAKIESPSPRFYRKSKTRYLDAPYAQGSIVASHHELRMGVDGWPERLAGAETVTLGTEQPSTAAGRQAASFAVRSETNYVIERSTAAQPLALATEGWTSLTIVTDGSRKPSSVRRSASHGRADLTKVPELGDLLATLRSGALKESAARLGWFRNTIDRLDAQTGRLDTAREALADTRDTPEQFQLLVGALAGSIEPDASAALLDAYRDDRYSQGDHTLIMNTWIASDTAFAPQTAAYLTGVAADPTSSAADAQNALLALGSQLGRVSDGSGASIESFLIARLASAQGEADTVAALDAMGNAGLPDFLAPVEPYLSNASAHIRAHAYLALRLIPGAAVTSLLGAGKADPSSEVVDSVVMAQNIRQSTD